MAIDAASTPCLECTEPLFERRHAETSSSMIWTLAKIWPRGGDCGGGIQP